MFFGGIITSPRNNLSPQKTLDLAKAYLEVALKIEDKDIALVLCYDTEISLSQAKRAAKHKGDRAVIKEAAVTYINLGKFLASRGHSNEAKVSYKKAEKLGVNVHDPVQPTRVSHLRSTLEPPQDTRLSTEASQTSSIVNISQASGSVHNSLDHNEQRRNAVDIPADIFAENVRPPSVEYKLPGPDERLVNTHQLAACLYLLQANLSPDDILDPTVDNWLQSTKNDADERERLTTMATEVIRAFKRDEIKDAKVVSEVVYLAPVLDDEAFRDLLCEFYSGIDHSGLLKVHQLEGLAQLIQNVDQSHLNADDLVKILGHLSERLKDTHKQATRHVYQLVLAVSYVLDAMADTKVKGLDREKLHEPLSSYLDKLKSSSDPYFVYQAAYAFQALLLVPDKETTWQAFMRRSGKVIQGVSGLMKAAKGLDLDRCKKELSDIQKNLGGASKVVEIVKGVYDDATSLVVSGKSLWDILKKGLSFEYQRDWYSALRAADALIRDGDLTTFQKLVCEAPCRLDPAFQWGVCQRLGEIAANPVLDTDNRRSAVAFLGEIYRNDEVWGQEASVKKWIINILMQLTSTSGTGSQLQIAAAESLLQELRSCGDDNKQKMYRSCLENGPVPYPLKISQPELPNPSLLDRVQNRPAVERSVRILRRQRIKERGNAVYIPPQAKASLQATDDTRFPLMEKVKRFLDSEQKVFLVMGDSGSGKSTFNRELEYELWQSYEKKTGRIPLHVHLPAIDKPEHDIIAKQLRKAEFTEPQIREMKHYRKFILICDGYDETQQTHNLYMSNKLNLEGEWNAQMVISCRTEYLGIDYRDRFQPGDHNRQSDPSLFQEAVLTPFSSDQVQTYIRDYVNLHQPLWQSSDYEQALELIPSLRDLVRNPFLMTLSLEVLPRMVDPGQHLSKARLTRVGLYDHFVEQWLERGKRRIGEKDLSPQLRATFEGLSNEGFTRNGMGYLKMLAAAIYKEQDGHPIVEYSRLVDKKSWKAEFFNGDDNQLLREACPLIRNGSQHRFLHRSLLEYGIARAIFDPQNRRTASTFKPAMNRQGSSGSILSFETENSAEERAAPLEKEPDPNSPLVWRTFVNDHSLLQFLEERVQQEPVFKGQLLSYIEHSKNDMKWRIAAANAITILVRADIQFIGADLRGIQIPGADLSYGVFDSAKLQNADLRKANLRGVWMRKTVLNGARMKGVQFGELPFLTEGRQIRSCAYSSDGRAIVVGLFDGNITVYSTSNWERIRTLSGHHDVVRRVAYSPRGNWIASASKDRTVRLWDAETGSQLHALTDHAGCVQGVAFSPQGDLVASCSDDMTVRLWSVATGECQRTLHHDGGVLSVAYSPSGGQIASGSADAKIWLWNVETAECIRIMSGHNSRIWEVAYSPMGDKLVSASDDWNVHLWDVETGNCRHVLKGHSSGVHSVAYSPKGDQVSSGGQDGQVRLWDVDTGQCRQILTGHDSVMVVAYSPTGDQLASGGYDKSLRLWDALVSSSRLVSSGHSTGVATIKCSPKEDRIASGSRDRTIRLWDAETGNLCHTMSGHTETVFSVAYSPLGDMIASGGGDNFVRLWSVESGRHLGVLAGHTNWVNSVAFSPDGNMVASASSDKTVRLWNMTTGDCQGILHGHTKEVLSVAYAPNGNQIATSSKDSTIRLWDMDTGECRRVLEGHHGCVRSVMYSPQGDQLASSSCDCTVRLWDVVAEECQRILIGHTMDVRRVAYSANGKLLASCSWDKTVRLWDVSSGESRAVVAPFPDSVWCVAWCASSDVNYLVTGCYDGSVLKWQVIEEEDECRVQLQWSASKGALNVIGASIHGTRGLTALNQQLLKQRGATGEPRGIFSG